MRETGLGNIIRNKSDLISTRIMQIQTRTQNNNKSSTCIGFQNRCNSCDV